jgi:hypothetical protein
LAMSVRRGVVYSWIPRQWRACSTIDVRES